MSARGGDVLQVILIAAILTFLFKQDRDTSSFESDIGKMKPGNKTMMPANRGESSTKQVQTT